MLYPIVSDFYNKNHQSQYIHTYDEEMNEKGLEKIEEMWKRAYEYNDYLLTKNYRFQIKNSEHLWYESLLNVNDGMMATLVIDKIHACLPIFHGDSEEVLQSALGHLEGSSLPVGSNSSHSLIMGHRGLPSSRLFTDLDQLEIGDLFEIHVLNEILIYKVDQIKVVEPECIEDLKIIENEDYVTLITCTPYGINTHRLLIRGSRLK